MVTARCLDLLWEYGILAQLRAAETNRIGIKKMRTVKPMCLLVSRDRIVVSTSRCGRDNPGSNPGHGRA